MRRRKMDPPWRALFLVLAVVGLSRAAPTVPDDCVSSPLEDGLSLHCSLSAINSASERTNFSVVPGDRTLALSVRCRQPALSRLEPDAFAHLKRMRRLSLDGCHLQVIPDRAFFGLTSLRALTIKTRSAGVLSVTSDAFIGVGSGLEQLDLSGNFIRQLPAHALCPLSTGLRALNLSRNEIAAFEDVAASLACLPALRSLDLSYNGLTSLQEDAAVTWASLEELRVNDNQLRAFRSGRILRGKPNLRLVDAANNRLTALPEDLLWDARHLKMLSLANNSLAQLPPAIFRGQSQSLEILDLSGNQLRSLPAQLFAGLTTLTSLDLSRNELVDIDAGAFKGLTSLQMLRLSDNRLATLPPLILPVLRSLVLSHNEISRLSPSAFAQIPLLSHLLLDGNALDDLPDRLFGKDANASSASKVTVLDLSSNRLSYIPRSVGALQSLQSLAVSGNYIEDLGRLQLPSLWRLQAASNRVRNVSALQLAGMPALQVLDLSSNKISSVEKGSFDRSSKQLQAIRLDGNQLTRIDGVFHDLPALTWLNVSANQIALFDFAMVPKTLQWLDLHQNKLVALENYFGLEAESGLAHLDASFNQIKDLGPQNVPDAVEVLLLNDNRIASLVPYTFFKKTKLKKVDLSVNRLETIDRNALRLTTAPDYTPSSSGDEDYSTSQPAVRPKFYLGGNPISCDCHMSWFKSVNSNGGSGDANLPIVADLESIYCQLLYSRDKSFVPLVDASADDFLCSYKTHCFALCHCCDYDACDCEMMCPENCTCYHDTTWTKNIAECSSSAFHDLPEQLPMDATEIFLDGNVIGDLRSHTFIGRKNLRVLFLNHSQITSVENHTFNGLAALEVLHLEGNSIGKLQGDEFNGLAQLRELYLHDNRISTVNNGTFRDLHSLRILKMHANRMAVFPVWQLSSTTALQVITLNENPWTCQCQFVEAFKTWLVSGEMKGKVVDAETIMCTLDSVSETRILDGAQNNSTCQDVATQLQQQLDVGITTRAGGNKDGGTSAAFKEFLPILVSVLVLFVLLSACAVFVFLYRNEMRVWLYSKYGVRFFHRIDGMSSASGSAGDEDDDDRVFDAFFAYSAKDDVFVRQMLAPELELGPAELRGGRPCAGQYKLCLFYRDLLQPQRLDRPFGDQQLLMLQSYGVADSLVQAAEASRRTVLVLSEHFIKNEWSRYDYKCGLQQALNSGSVSRHRRRHRLVVILLGAVADRRDLDPDLRLFLKTGVVLQWGEKSFWQKLRFALPEVSGRDAASFRESALSSAFAPDNESFRYETYHRNQQLHNPSQHVYSTIGSYRPLAVSNSSSFSTTHSSHRHSNRGHNNHRHSNRGGNNFHTCGFPQSSSVSMGGDDKSSGTFNSAVTSPDEQDSTRTMTIHI